MDVNALNKANYKTQGSAATGGGRNASTASGFADLLTTSQNGAANTGATDDMLLKAMGESSKTRASEPSDRRDRRSERAEEAPRSDRREKTAEKVRNEPANAPKAADDSRPADSADSTDTDVADASEKASSSDSTEQTEQSTGMDAVVQNPEQNAQATETQPGQTQTAQSEVQATTATQVASTAATADDAPVETRTAASGTSATTPAAPQQAGKDAAVDGEQINAGQVDAAAKTAGQAKVQQATPAQADKPAAQAASTANPAADAAAAKAAEGKGKTASVEQSTKISDAIGDKGETAVKVQVSVQAEKPAVVRQTAPQAPQGDAALGETVRAPSSQNANYYAANQNGGNNGQQNAPQQNGQQQGQANAGSAPQANAAAAAQQQAVPQMTKAAEPAPPQQSPQTTQTTQPTQGVGATQTSQFQQSGQTQQAQATQRPQQMPREAVVEQVKVRIAQGAANGQDTIKIQLRPQEMGRVDVKLEIRDGSVTAHVVADSRETLDMLKSDSRSLEKALSDAGLKTDSGSLNFSMRGESQQNMAREGSGRGTPYDPVSHKIEDDLQTDVPDVHAQRSARAAMRGGLDVRV